MRGKPFFDLQLKLLPQILDGLISASTGSNDELHLAQQTRTPTKKQASQREGRREGGSMSFFDNRPKIKGIK